MAKKAARPAVQNAMDKLISIRRDGHKYLAGVRVAIEQIREDLHEGLFTLEEIGTSDKELDQLLRGKKRKAV